MDPKSECLFVLATSNVIPSLSLNNFCAFGKIPNTPMEPVIVVG